MASEGKDIFILGGPNGAEKTTAAEALLPGKLRIDSFLNADEIARRISPNDVDAAAFAAGRQMIEQMRTLVREHRSFAFIYDNRDRALRLIARREDGSPLIVIDAEIWSRIEELTP